MGMPVDELRTSSMLPIQKQSVMIIVSPSDPLKKVAQTIADGRTLPASFNSSDMWAPASGPRKHHRGVVIPTRQERPTFPHPPPSLKVPNTWLAGAWSLIVHKTIKKAKYPKMWTIRKIPSARGSFPARKTLKATATTRKSMMNSVVCQRAATLAFSFFSKIRPWTSVEVSCAAEGQPVTHPRRASQPTI